MSFHPTQHTFRTQISKRRSTNKASTDLWLGPNGKQTEAHTPPSLRSFARRNEPSIRPFADSIANERTCFFFLTVFSAKQAIFPRIIFVLRHERLVRLRHSLLQRTRSETDIDRSPQSRAQDTDRKSAKRSEYYTGISTRLIVGERTEQAVLFIVLPEAGASLLFLRPVYSYFWRKRFTLGTCFFLPVTFHRKYIKGGSVVCLDTQSHFFLEYS